ncbi:dynein axonemal assembly factor 4-like [Malaya genurostris]|uniref:dynein axonemal assembly factor 4-like n=1 Tax=Malaya genurostris TaxID=325434 RepID=UPI0026F3B0A2|nr:dynein axonemal assembly factor 4-like [Malaya genurostris]
MPVILKNFSWSQDSEQVTIRVSFPENHLRREEVFTSVQLLKINKAPYYWEALLLHPVVEEESRCLLLENEVIFSLRKTEIGLQWDQLELECTNSERILRKEELLAGHRKRLEEKVKQRSIARDQNKREEVSRQIERDGNTRTEIEKLLEDSKQREMKRMDTPRPKEFKKPRPKSEPSQELPSIRQCGTVTVSFSKRNFVTPKRESMEHDEQQWIMKQAAAKKAVGFIDDDLRPEERNPEWLKQKGDSFFQQRNYLAAISAYTTGIRLNKEYYSLFLNRSAAHFALENYQRCAEDCSTALELLIPPIEANRKARVACLARRGAALAKLGFLRQGFEELVAAAKLDPQNDELRRETQMLQRKLDECDTESE